jgi:primosomal protein N' (replication factor Y)
LQGGKHVEPFARIIVNILHERLDRSFTYSIPEGMNVKVGSRVIVPFGTRRLEGYCVEISSGGFSGETKQIEEVLDEVPLLTGELVDLASWGAGRYLCRKIDFLQAMIPSGVRWTTNQWVSYTGIGEPDNPSLAYLKKRGAIKLSVWVKKFPLLEQGTMLRHMQQSGIISIRRQEHRGVSEKTVRTVSLTKEAHYAEVKGKQQSLALRILLDQGTVTVPELKSLGIGDAVLRALTEKGLVEIGQTQVMRSPLSGEKTEASGVPELTQAQADALRLIESGAAGEEPPRPVLLHGVTGSGKTEVYLQAISRMMKSGKGSIVLVPEIALTPQMIERFTGRFGDNVAVLHSRLSAGERYDEWRRIVSGEALVVIGARSAVFAPFKELGLLILDEEHEHTYKQEEAPRYHAREIALWRARRHHATVVLGSATPSLESYRKAVLQEYTLCNLPERIEKRPLPPVEVVDMRQELKEGHRSIFSRALLAGLEETVKGGRQAILFLNRRGFATFVLCRECGFVMRCPSCQVSLKFHLTGEQLRCHYCDYSESYPVSCPSCSGRYIRHFGTGTQKVEEELLRFFPDIRAIRLDADTTSKKGSHQKILSSFKSGQFNVLIGTQMVAKGLDFPNVTLVGVITADTALNLPDFRAGERTFQLLTQVSGRAGRSAAGGSVVVQTYAPGHYAVVAAKTHDYQDFYSQEIQTREELGYPPFSHLVRLLLAGSEEGKVIDAAGELAALLEQHAEVLGPSPCPIAKLRGNFRWHLLVRSEMLAPLLDAVDESTTVFRKSPLAGSVRVSVDVDPQSLL